MSELNPEWKENWLPPMDTDKRTIKNDMDSYQITNIETISYLLSVLSVSIGGNLWIFHLEQKGMGNVMKAEKELWKK